MDSVLQNLDECVDNMKNVSETQEKLDATLTKIETVGKILPFFSKIMSSNNKSVSFSIRQ